MSKRVEFKNVLVDYCNLQGKLNKKALLPNKANIINFGRSMSVLFEKGTPQAAYANDVFKVLKNSVEAAYEQKNSISPQGVRNPLKQAKKSPNHLVLTFPYKQGKAFLSKEEEINENGELKKVTGRYIFYKEVEAMEAAGQDVSVKLEEALKLNKMYSTSDKIDVFQIVDGVKVNQIKKNDGTTLPLFVQSGDIVNITCDILAVQSEKKGEEGTFILRPKLVSIEIVQRSNNNYSNSDYGYTESQLIDLSNVQVPESPTNIPKPNTEVVTPPVQNNASSQSSNNPQITMSDILGNKGWS